MNVETVRYQTVMRARSTLRQFAVVTALIGAASLALAKDTPPPPPDFFVPSPVPTTYPAPVRSSERMPAGYLDAIGRRLGLNPCNYAFSRRFGKPVDAVALVEAKDNGCALWESPTHPAVNSFLGSINVETTRIPIVGYASLQTAPATSGAIVLNLVGGPAGDISPGLNDLIQEGLAARGAIVVKPAYAGTRHRSGYPKPDFDKAVWEVIRLIRSLHRTSPQSKIVLMGESLGGYIAAKVVASAGDLPVSGLMLVVPLVYSPDRAIRNFHQLAVDKHQGFTPLWLRSDPLSGSGTLPDRSPGQPVPEYRAISSIDLFDAYFPKKGRTVGLLTYIAQSRGIPVLIAYGADDERVGVGDLRNGAFKLPQVRLLELHHTGHAIDASAARRIVNATWSTFSLPE